MACFRDNLQTSPPSDTRGLPGLTPAELDIPSAIKSWKAPSYTLTVSLGFKMRLIILDIILKRSEIEW